MRGYVRPSLSVGLSVSLRNFFGQHKATFETVDTAVTAFSVVKLLMLAGSHCKGSYHDNMTRNLLNLLDFTV